jgi:hypothetical protein
MGTNSGSPLFCGAPHEAVIPECFYRESSTNTSCKARLFWMALREMNKLDSRQKHAGMTVLLASKLFALTASRSA